MKVVYFEEIQNIVIEISKNSRNGTSEKIFGLIKKLGPPKTLRYFYTKSSEF